MSNSARGDPFAEVPGRHRSLNDRRDLPVDLAAATTTAAIDGRFPWPASCPVVTGRRHAAVQQPSDLGEFAYRGSTSLIMQEG